MVALSPKKPALRPWLSVAWLFAVGWANAVEPLASPRLAAADVYVGGEPHVDADWERLAELGIRTVVSVDALGPNADAARRRGLRVVHVPMGYGGITPAEAEVLARVARECERPLYIYCHHGRHRGPAAAAIVCRAAGLLDERGAIDLLTSAGTSRDYEGLWRAVAQFDPATPPSDAPLVARAKAAPLAIEMGRLSRAWDEFVAGPDAAKLLVVREALRESRRNSGAPGRPGSTVASIPRNARSRHLRGSPVRPGPLGLSKRPAWPATRRIGTDELGGRFFPVPPAMT